MRIILDILKWRFDVFERYRFCINRLNKKGLPILEIGAGEYGLEYFGFKNITTTDINERWKYLDITKPLSGSFPQFDVVVAIDVIEHIVPKRRMFAVEQMCEIAKRKIILSVPNGLIAYKLDKKLDKFLSKKGYRSKHLREHIKYGILDIESFTKKLRKIPQIKKVEVFNGIDIATHERLARFLCHKIRLIFLLKNKLLYPVKNLIVSRSRSDTPYHKVIEINF